MSFRGFWQRFQFTFLQEDKNTMRAFECTEGDEDLAMIEDPLEALKQTLEDAITFYHFAPLEQEDLHTRLGRVTIYGRNHQELEGEDREPGEFPYDFVVIFNVPFAIRIWCQDFRDLLAFIGSIDDIIAR